MKKKSSAGFPQLGFFSQPVFTPPTLKATMFVHGNNLEKKITDAAREGDAEAIRYLNEIKEKYDAYKAANTALKGPYTTAEATDITVITQRTTLFEDYKKFVDQQHYAEKFDSRSNLHSSVLEEFMFYIFRDLVLTIAPNALVGKAHAFKDMFFHAKSYSEMVLKPNTKVEKKDHDFVIGISVHSEMNCEGKTDKEIDDFHIPAVVIECKTYLDKTMLEASSMAADQLMHKSPNAIYILVAEWLKLTESVNLRKYRVNQIYVLRKQKNTDRGNRYAASYVMNPIYPDAIMHLFNTVRTHLTTDWEGGVAYGLTNGYLL